MSAETHLKAYQELVDRRLEELLPPESQLPFELHAAMRYSCLAPGKRLRPALCMASAEVFGGDAGRVVDAAAALEMVHCFSLIHDDLPAIDDDDLRRGRPTCHVKYGEAMAILAGDALFALAYQTISEVAGDKDRVLRSVQILARAVGSDGLVGGEVADVQSEGRPLDADILEFIHTRKTGALIAASCEIGALLAGGTAEQVCLLRRFGTHVGLAFQVADDLLNETSTAEALGKAAGTDRLRQKATYPALYGVEASREAAKRAVESGLCDLKELGQPATVLEELACYAVERLY
jgi:geranylgeranyl diphosphate synthase, type II